MILGIVQLLHQVVARNKQVRVGLKKSRQSFELDIAFVSLSQTIRLTVSSFLKVAA